MHLHHRSPELQFPTYSDQVEIFKILLVESIPKMLGLKKFELVIRRHVDQQFFDMQWDSASEGTTRRN
jgi:hypothetical protein